MFLYLLVSVRLACFMLAVFLKISLQKSPCVILYKRQFMQISIYTIGEKFSLEIDVFSVFFTNFMLFNETSILEHSTLPNMQLLY